MKRGRYQIGAELRQQALDYINANPGAIGPEIITTLGWEKSTGATRLQDMVVAGELRRNPTECYVLNKHGRQQLQRTYAYWAICEKTRSAMETTERVAANLHRRGDTSKKGKVTRVNDPNRPPIPNQGGQGNIGQRIRCGSSLS